MTSKYYITWEEFHGDVKNLAAKLAKGKFNKIIAVSRGGLLPAGILAYELDIRNSQAVNVSSYDNDSFRPDDEVEIDLSVGEVDEKTLVVDDISDSGRTFRLMRALFPKAHFAAVYAKEKGLPEVDVCARQVPEEWIVFPWDL